MKSADIKVKPHIRRCRPNESNFAWHCESFEGTWGRASTKREAYDAWRKAWKKSWGNAVPEMKR